MAVADDPLAGITVTHDPVHCLLTSAMSGLFPTAQPPETEKDAAARTRFLLGHMEQLDCSVRLARPEDLPALVVLERSCWPQSLRTHSLTLRRRIRRYPEGQLVLLSGGAVVGVIYSQRIRDVAVVDGVTAAQVDTLHDPDGPIVQLLAVNVLPAMQQSGLGDRLLEFMLIYRSLQDTVEQVVAVTLCRNFEAGKGVTLEEYIARRNAQGVLADPVLRFHELHGAAIERVVPGYRPSDMRNGGAGVLVRYDIRRRKRAELTIIAEPPAARTRVTDIDADVADVVRACLRDELAEGFAFDRPLMAMGIDSADLLQLKELLAARCGRALPATFFFEYNTPRKIADRLRALQAPADGSTQAPLASSAVQTERRGHADPARLRDVAVVGMACRLPGGIDAPEALWQCLIDGRSVITTMAEDRWEWPPEIDPAGKHRGIDRGGFLTDVAAFDAPFFRVSPAEAETMDPQQRILLELCWQAIEHAGHAPDTLAGSRTGVFVGASGSDYARRLDRSGQTVEPHYGTGSAVSVLANRVSYVLDLHGPSVVLDTACSSSLVALHGAVRSIVTGESEQALVGAVNVMLHPASSIAYYKAGMLSKDGLCRTFDHRANGYVRAEGAVVLFLKPLATALTDGDRIHAVIKGSACNHGGRANGLTVPDPLQQGRLLSAAWRDADIDASDLGYIEAHGTGTPLGDPIEVQGIRNAFDLVGAQPRDCGLGSVKTNLGHLEAAAGLAGVLKAILSLQQGQLPPSLHFQRLNDHIALPEAGLAVVDTLRPWPVLGANGARLAGVSSFGSGGTNAHVVIAEYPHAAAVTPEPEAPVLFVLSARTPERLEVCARRYAAWLAGEGSTVPLADVAWQLQVGRTAMEERLALVATSRAGLIASLAAFHADASRPVGKAGTARDEYKALLRGEAGRAFVKALVAQGDLERIGLLWSAGADLDWSLMHGAARSRVVLPTYPFARHAYWLPGAPSIPAARSQAPEAAAAIALVPLWRPAPGETDPLPGPDAAILVVGADERLTGMLRARYPAARFATDTAAAGDANLAWADHVVWIAPPADGAATGDSGLLERQNSGLLALFRLVRALLRAAGPERQLGLTLVTWRTHAVFAGDATDPAHAGVHGFAGVLARECPGWSIRALDLDTDDEGPLAWFAAPAMPNGELLARRQGRWWRRVLVEMLAPAAPLPPYRQGGVYVVVGGAGGIGEAWSRAVIHDFRAQIIWIGRRALDATIQAKIDALGRIGPPPVYLQADVADRDSLALAVAVIRRRWPGVNGVIHAATGRFDSLIAATEEEQFREILASKVDAAVHVADAFRAEPLDFLVYFSSIMALDHHGGYAGYAAGGAFTDAYALHCGSRADYPVKVINWGHWEVGTALAISDATRTRLLRTGHSPILPGEGMAALQQLLIQPMPQLALVKTVRREAIPLLVSDERWVVHADTAPSCAEAIQALGDLRGDQAAALAPACMFRNAVLEDRLLRLLAAALPSPEDVSDALPPFYRCWLAETDRLLAAANTPRPAPSDRATAWLDWDRAKRETLACPDLRPALDLADACLGALPDILAGRIAATDVIFPGASMRLVEGVYRGNAVADHFNTVLADALVAAIEARVGQDPAARLRIIEIGAGTGGTTGLVLERLEPLRSHIEEYAFTDVSKAFLFQAEERFVRSYSFVRPMLFDVQRSPEGQGVPAGHYDIAIATNVLHATPDIRSTLNTCKAVLSRHGLLLLNEIGVASLFAHVTFGLLEGWWLTADPELRLPGAPLLSPEGWQAVLRQAGFPVVAFPAAGSFALGQQVIVAESDGVVRRIADAPAPARLAHAASPGAGPSVSTGTGPEAAVTAWVRSVVAKVLRLDSQEVDPHEPLEAYGIDSILVVQITEALRGLVPEVSRTLLFECQTVHALGKHLLLHHRAALAPVIGAAAPSPPPAPPLAPEPQRHVAPLPASGAGQASPLPDPIAIIGMSCRFPQAVDLDAYWEVLRSGRNCIAEIPESRWPLRDFYHAEPEEAVERGRSYSKWGGLLDGVTEFDPMFFKIAPREAAAIDPQERLFLQTAWETLEDAGYTRARIGREAGRSLGVFVGITRTGFDLFGPPLWRQGETIHPHTSFSSVANRLSYFLDARGPSMPVDTMCSSSLSAVHQACQSLRAGECRMAIAGGVNLYLHPSGYVGLSAARMLSRDGLCCSFGKGGNGFVPGEGVAAILLKPLSRALADGDRIYATIRATHVNHGGKTNGYTVPNPQAQADLVREALEKAGIDARAVSYIEAHGTGTELGDPIEVTGLTKAFRSFTADSGFCALGSAKSNIGHLEAAAGIAGLIKVVLQLRHRMLVPSLHASDPNPNIDFAATPFVVQQTLAPWDRPRLPTPDGVRECPRIAGVSAFGAGGANAHVVLEEFPEPARPEPLPGRPYPVLLSARTDEQLKAAAARLLGFIQRRGVTEEAPALADIAYTLQVGREPLEWRIGFLAQSLEEARTVLAAFVGGATSVPELHAGHARQRKALVEAREDEAALQDRLVEWFRNGEYARLLDLWTKGIDIDWSLVHREAGDTGRPPRCISLPTYPFDRTRYWLPEVRDIPANTVPVAGPPAHPAADAPAVVPERIERDAGPGRPKPGAITLADPLTITAPPRSDIALRERRLSPLAATPPAGRPTEPTDAASADLIVFDHGDGVLAVVPDPALRQPMRAGAAAVALAACFEWIGSGTRWPDGEKSPPRVVVLGGLSQLFPAGESAPEAVSGFVAMLTACPVPVVTCLGGTLGRAAMLVAAASDLLICSADTTFDPEPAALTVAERAALNERFGAALEAKAPISAETLRGGGWAGAVVPADSLDAAALELARDVARAEGTALSELKRHLRSGSATPGPSSPVTLTTGFSWADRHRPDSLGPPQSVPLAEACVTVERYRDGVVLVRMVDRANRNTSSPALVRGLTAAFDAIRDIHDAKVVVLTGFDQFFACGGTKEGLLAIQRGQARFTDEQTYVLPLMSDLPVIAAMQGHAIGAGWAMGLFADWTIYSEESVYQSPYMLYGFTPGAGSTLVFPHRLGHDLSAEILFSAREYRGWTLRERQPDATVMPRTEVLPCALALAGHLTRHSRAELLAWKRRSAGPLRDRLQAVFARELAMHDRTFVDNPAVLARLARHFDKAKATEAAREPAHAAGEVARRSWTPAEVLVTLRQGLAAELLLPAEQLDVDAAFTDLGLDSISAVTWIRSVNRQFGTSLGATTVYNHATIACFAEFVAAGLAGGPALPTGSEGPSLAWLRQSLAQELLLSEDGLDDDTPVVDLGLDSVTAVTWIRAINRRFDLAVGATTIYSYPTLSEFLGYLTTLVRPRAPEADAGTAETPASPSVLLRRFPIRLPSPDSLPVTAPPLVPAAAAGSAGGASLVPSRASSPRIAIIGMAGQFPKSPDLSTFWRNLTEGRDCVSDIPASRWSIDAYYAVDRQAPGKTVCRRLGVLDDIDRFDPLFFSIAPAEAELMDPQQRLFLENSWRCIEDAGYDPRSMSGSLCGVFAGCAASDYSNLLAQLPPSAHALIGESVAMLPARIAYVLDLHGPCLAIDTACSASLVAIANACDSLVLGTSDLALAGGVYIINGPDIHVKMSQAGMLSPDGTCFSFDQRANGFVPGEGVGVVLLKRLEDAERDGDDIYAVLSGWGVNQDGRTNGITAPSQDAQTRLEAGIYRRFGIDPGQIGLVEAHGTGTKLGDPIEVEALSKAFRQFTDQRGFCALGSVKANVGHLATAAGVCGTIKAVLALSHARLPPTIHHQTLNEHIVLDGSPFYVNTECLPWPAQPGQLRQAAVSSFGFSGTNAHLVLEEYPARVEPPVAAALAVILPLSARSASQLLAYAKRVGDFLATADGAALPPLADIAHTFQVGRPAFSHRLAIVAGSIAEARRLLEHYVVSGVGAPGCHVGEVGTAGADAGTAEDALTREARRWVTGSTVEWRSLWLGANQRRRHGLPTYPFEPERYWAVQRVEPDAKPVADFWHASPLSAEIDWTERTRLRLAGRCLLVCPEGWVRESFTRLLTQLRMSGGIDAVAVTPACGIGELDAAIARERPMQLVFIGIEAADLSALLPRLPAGLRIVAGVEAERPIAEALGTAIMAGLPPAGGSGLLLSQTASFDDPVGLQRLFREWLAADEAGLVQVHYAGDRRLLRTTPEPAPAEPIRLLGKVWQPQPASIAVPARLRGRVMILVNATSARLARSLFGVDDFRGVLLVAGRDGVSLDGVTVVDLDDAGAARRLLERSGDVTHVIDLADLHLEADATDSSVGRLRFYQGLVSSGEDLTLLHVTSGLQVFRAGRMSLAGAAIAGLTKMLSAEYRHIQARSIDLDQDAWRQPGELRRILLQECDAPFLEPELCYRDGERFAPEMELRSPAVTHTELPVAHGGVYVVTGGTNGVGLEIADLLRARGCSRLVLMGITALPPRHQWRHALEHEELTPYVRAKLLKLIELDGALEVLEVHTGSLTDMAALGTYFAGVRSRLGPIRGVVHAAGVYSDRTTPAFAAKDPRRIQQVWEPKAAGLVTLFETLRAEPLDFFVALSSMTALLPELARGAADYAMANAFVDFFIAYQRHQRGDLRARSVVWSDWHETGAITRLSPEEAAPIRRTFADLGLRTFSNAEGRRLFEAALSCPADGTVVIGYVDSDRFERVRPGLLRTRQPDTPTPRRRSDDLRMLLDDWETRRRMGDTVSVQEVMSVVDLDGLRGLDHALVDRLHGVLFGTGQADPGADDKPDYAEVITRIIKEVLKLQSVNPVQPFQSYGLDSISATVLATRLEKALKRRMRPQWLIEFPTVEALSRHLTSDLAA